MLKHLKLLLLCLSVQTGFTQMRIDSLQLGLDTAKVDSIKLSFAMDLVAAYAYSNLDSALMYALQCEEIAERITENPRKLAIARNYLATMYNFRGEYKKAIETYLKSLEVSESIGFRRSSSTVYGNLGHLYAHEKQFDKALQYIRRAEKINIEDNYPDKLADNYNNIGIVYYNQEQWDSAAYYFNKAMPLYKETVQPMGVGKILNNLGAISFNQKKYEEALRYYEEALDIHRSIDNTADVALNLQNIGGVFVNLGKPERAIPLYKEAMALANEINSNRRKAEIYEETANAYAEMGQYKQAYENYQQFYALRDSLASELNSETVAEMETRYQTEQIRAQVAEKELELSQQKNRQKNILIGSVIVLFLVIAVFQYFRQQQRLRRRETELALQLERSEAEKLREMDKLKSSFFANISHEFRTPLTLLVSPLKQLQEGIFQGDVQRYYQIMLRNAERLLQLVNQLLDLSKLESGREQLTVTQQNISALIYAIAHSFESLAWRRQISYKINGPEEAIIGFVDRDKLEKVLTNIISNAYKFTPEEGKIEVTFEQERENLNIRIADTGIGIKKEDLPFLFERFYQSDVQSDIQAGSGIGLALTKELIELHKGTISVDSEEGEGTTFFFSIPTAKTAYQKEEITTEQPPEHTEKVVVPYPIAAQQVEGATNSQHEERLLIVEDNADVRQFICDQLSHNYSILEAINGKQGLELAIQHTPDLIITDLMMPEMDGIEMSQRLKAEEKTSHIPLIMLTAKADREDKLEGLQTGADDYLIKPFDAEELRTRVQNLIDQRKRLRKKYAETVLTISPDKVEAPSLDDVFLQKVKAIIEEHLDDELFGVVELSEAQSLSRSQLHRKLKALTGKSPNEIIREMRLLRAKDLLEQGAGNASEVAFMVGFNSLAYFSKCFRDYFRQPPSAITKSDSPFTTESQRKL